MKWRKLDWPQDQMEFRDFLFANKDYFTKYQTYSPSDEEIEQEFFLSIPTHTQLTQKEVFGIYQADQLMGVVDLLHDYPKNKTTFLGLLVIDLPYRQQGNGQIFYQQLEHYCRQQGVKTLRLGVLVDNLTGRKRWEKQRFVKIADKTIILFVKRN